MIRTVFSDDGMALSDEDLREIRLLVFVWGGLVQLLSHKTCHCHKDQSLLCLGFHYTYSFAAVVAVAVGEAIMVDFAVLLGLLLLRILLL